MLSAPNKEQKTSELHAIAAVPLGTVGIAVSQDHQGSSILASDVSGVAESSTLHAATALNSFGDKKKVSSSAFPSLAPSCTSVFSQNVALSALSLPFSPPAARSDNIAPFAYCHNLLREYISPSVAAANTAGEPLKPNQQGLIEPYAQSEDNSRRIRLLIQMVVEEFAADALKTTAIPEVVLLAPSLDKEYYRKLLNCVIVEFENLKLLDLPLLQGLIQLVESASSDYLKPDDLARILAVLCVRLQGTQEQSVMHTYYLAWALSRLLDVMVEGKVKGLRRLVDQEPLSALFSQLKDTDDFYLKHQVIYAFQGLLHVPNDETRRQCMVRYAGRITMGLLGVASVCKLDQEQFKDGTDHLYDVAGDLHKVSKFAVGEQSLFESGQGIWSSVKGGIFSGGRQLWYTSLREAQQYIRNGQLQDFSNLIFGAPCRHHVEFQWGICQLLGGIVADSVLETSIRQQAVNFLGELYRNDSIWTPSDGIHHWILDILCTILALRDTAISDHAQLVLLDLERVNDASKQELYHDTQAGPLCFYPIQYRLPIPTSSTLLSRVIAIPTVELELLRLKNLRLEEQESVLYIPPYAKSSLRSSDDTLFPLMEKVLEFLAGPSQVFLLLGDSGGGKSTFNMQLEHTIWKSYKKGDPIPLHISLPSIDNPQHDIIAKQLRQFDFTDVQIMELKQNRQFVVICDGYDESQLASNIHTSNHFNRPGQWNVKMIITCRTQYLGSNYRNRFAPQGNTAYNRAAIDLFQEAVIAPFTKEQIQRYIDIYVPLEPRIWGTKDYMDKLTSIPNLMDLVKNPFLLSLALEALPGVTEGKQDLSTIRVNRVQLYDKFVQHWFEVNQRRLERNNDALSSEDQSMLDQMVEADFVSLGIEYLTKLARAIFDKQDGNPVVQYVQLSDTSEWKAEFFGAQPKARLLRESSPLTRTGNHFRFVHRSMLEYFFSRVICNPANIDEECDLQVELVPVVSQLLDASPLFQRNLLREPSIIQFLSDRVNMSASFKHQLRAVIDLSKTDANAAIGATNAITILVRAGVTFNGADLRGIKVSGADLSYGQFDSAQFQGADLKNVNLSKSWLRQTDMSDAHMEGVRFGELPYLEMDSEVRSCAYSPDGGMLGVALFNGNIFIYDTSTWTKLPCLAGHDNAVISIAFSLNSQQLVSGGYDKKIRLWDTTSGGELLVMEGHSDYVSSVAISPDGNQIASASYDETVRLWDAQTGDNLLLLEGHWLSIMSLKYSPDGYQLVSGSFDGTVRFWDANTGDPGVFLIPSNGEVTCLAYSPDGRWVAVGHLGGQLQLWGAGTLEPGPILGGHVGTVTRVDFSPDGKWVSSSSKDRTVRIWDASTGALVTVQTGHNHSVNCVAFSPGGRQIASAGDDCKVRLWEVGSSWSNLDLRGGGRVKKLTYSRDGKSILSYDVGGIFQQWDAATGASAPILYKVQQEIRLMAYAPDGSQLAFGYSDGSIHLWNCQTSTAGSVLEGHSSSITILVYSPCCRWIVSVDERNTVRMWDLHDVEPLYHPVDVGEDLNGDVSAVTFSSTGGQFAINARWFTICQFDTQSRECLSRMKLQGSISALVYSPNDQQIAIGTKERRIYLWDLRSKEPRATLEGHEDLVACIAYSPCGQWIASSSEDKTVGIWQRQLFDGEESWSKMHSICAYFGSVGNVTWNPVVPMEFGTGCEDGSVQVWRMAIGEGGKVVFRMAWSSNSGTLCTEGAVFTNAVGLSPIYKKLLVQRGASCASDDPVSSFD